MNMIIRTTFKGHPSTQQPGAVVLGCQLLAAGGRARAADGPVRRTVALPTLGGRPAASCPVVCPSIIHCGGHSRAHTLLSSQAALLCVAGW